VTLQGSSTYVIRDVTDLNHPFTASTLGDLAPLSGPKAAYAPQIVAGTDLAYYGDDGVLMRKPFDGSPLLVTTPCDGFLGFTWSSDGARAAYATDANGYSTGQVRMVFGGHDSIFGDMPAQPLAGCLPPCDEYVDLRILFSPDGRYLAFNSYWRITLRVWSIDGRVLEAIDSEEPGHPHSGPTMSVWSGSGYFYRDWRGVEVWRDGVTSLVIPGVAWIRPKGSPAGGQVVYVAKDQAGIPDVFLLDTASGTARLIVKSRSNPVFLTPRYLWYRGERTCAAGEPYPCGAEGTILTGKTYIYDLQTGSESESIIKDVWDVWPHPA